MAKKKKDLITEYIDIKGVTKQADQFLKQLGRIEKAWDKLKKKLGE